jgi:hypothetical protein
MIGLGALLEGLEAPVVSAIGDLVRAVLKHDDPAKLARDLAAEAAHRTATLAAIDAALMAGQKPESD